MAKDVLTPRQRDWLANSWTFECGGWTYLHIAGAPYARGFQHGYRLAAAIAAALADNAFQNEWSTGDDRCWFAEQAEQLYADKLGAELRSELEGIAAGVEKAGHRCSFGDILAFNATMELLGNWWPLHRGKPVGEPRVGDHCNSFVATGDGVTADGGIVLAHNTWDTYIDANSSNVVLSIRPDAGVAILMQSRPGFIHSGTDFFVCGSGIIGAETTIAGFSGYDHDETPEFVRVRNAMQYAEDLDQWIEIMLTGNNGGYANSWMLGDINTGEIAKFELGLAYHGLQRTHRGSYWGCNVVEDKRIRYQECEAVGYSNLMKNASRRVRWERFLRETPQLDVDLGRRILADHYDEFEHRDNPGTRTICAHFDRDDGSFAPLEYGPFYPYGTNDGKVTDSALAAELRFEGIYGHPCGQAFDAGAFLQHHPQYAWMRDHLQSKPRREWVAFCAAQRPAR